MSLCGPRISCKPREVRTKPSAVDCFPGGTSRLHDRSSVHSDGSNLAYSRFDSGSHEAQGSTIGPSRVPFGSASGHVPYGPTRTSLPAVFPVSGDKSASQGPGTVTLGLPGQDNAASSHLVELFRQFVERCSFPVSSPLP